MFDGMTSVIFWEVLACASSATFLHSVGCLECVGPILSSNSTKLQLKVRVPWEMNRVTLICGEPHTY